MRIVKVSRDIFPEINLDDFNRQQKITRIYVKKDNTYVLEAQPGVMDWSIDKKREVAKGPESLITTVIFSAPASMLFSTSSLTTEEGLCTTSPAAMRFDICEGRTLSILQYIHKPTEIVGKIVNQNEEYDQRNQTYYLA